MVKKLLLVMLVALMSAGALAFTFMGPPTAELQKGQWKAGYTYSFSQMDIDAEEADGDNYTLKDAEMNRHYFDLGYGAVENLELNLLLGVASIDLDEYEYPGGSGDDWGFDGSNEFSWGFNTKYTFIKGEKVDWGAMLQMTWFSPEYEYSDGYKEEIDAYDLQIAVGPTVDMGCWKLYGGAYFYMLDGDIEGTESDGTFDYKDDLEEADSFGGYVGATFEIMKNTDVAVEFALSNDTYGIGANIGWKF